ncbi:MAG: hypothetical protein Q4A52_07885 [Bacillota bacterium]|nr:hypothetical protein [Bacillota bacterium]
MEAMMENRFQVDRLNNESQRMEKELRWKRTLRRIVGGVIKVAAMLIFLAGCLYLLQIRTLIDEVNNDNIRLENENHSIRVRLQEIEVQIQMQTMLENVEKIAMEEFGMIYPDKAQVVRLKQEQQFALEDSEEPIFRLVRLNR